LRNSLSVERDPNAVDGISRIANRQSSPLNPVYDHVYRRRRSSATFKLTCHLLDARGLLDAAESLVRGLFLASGLEF